MSVIERETTTRMAAVRGAALVQIEKVHELDRLGREAMTGQAMLSTWAATLAKGDVFASDDLKLFADLVKMAKAEVIAETATSFNREGRR